MSGSCSAGALWLKDGASQGSHGPAWVATPCVTMGHQSHRFQLGNVVALSGDRGGLKMSDVGESRRRRRVAVRCQGAGNDGGTRHGWQ